MLQILSIVPNFDAISHAVRVKRWVRLTSCAVCRRWENARLEQLRGLKCDFGSLNWVGEFVDLRICFLWNFQMKVSLIRLFAELSGDLKWAKWRSKWANLKCHTADTGQAARDPQAARGSQVVRGFQVDGDSSLKRVRLEAPVTRRRLTKPRTCWD